MGTILVPFGPAIFTAAPRARSTTPISDGCTETQPQLKSHMAERLEIRILVPLNH
jgi:hypothetical protein